MTHDRIKEVIEDLLRRHRLAAAAADTYRVGDGGRERCYGKAFAYRHAADMLGELLAEPEEPAEG